MWKFGWRAGWEAQNGEYRVESRVDGVASRGRSVESGERGVESGVSLPCLLVSCVAHVMYVIGQNPKPGESFHLTEPCAAPCAP